MPIVAVGNPRPPTFSDSPAGCRWGLWHASETLTLIQPIDVTFRPAQLFSSERMKNKHAPFQTRVPESTKPYPSPSISRIKSSKITPSGAEQTYIAYIKEYPTGLPLTRLYKAAAVPAPTEPLSR